VNTRDKFLVMATVLNLGWLPSVSADGCRTEDEQQAAVQLRQAEEAERAGKLKQAYGIAQQIDDMCLKREGGMRRDAMQKRIGLQLGQQEEKQGRFDAAFDWYQRSRNEAEADRVKMKQVAANPANRKLVSGAIEHFKQRSNDARLAELRRLAESNFSAALAGEDRAFAARKDSLRELDHARDWGYLIGDGAAAKIRARAAQRGEILLKEDTYRRLENALSYFHLAEAKPREKALKDKALRLAQEHEKKGEIAQAQEFYSLAGAGARGDALEKRAEAQHKKSEAKRQKQFKKEQDDLEKQLGL
jgi:hypothetical protein